MAPPAPIGRPTISPHPSGSGAGIQKAARGAPGRGRILEEHAVRLTRGEIEALRRAVGDWVLRDASALTEGGAALITGYRKLGAALGLDGEPAASGVTRPRR